MLIAGMRQSLPLAHSIVTLDRASNGRLHLGIGSGASLPESKAEFEAAGMAFAGRTDRLDESVRAWKQAWTPPDARRPEHRFQDRSAFDQLTGTAGRATAVARRAAPVP